MELRYKTGGVKCPAFPFHYVQSHYKLGSSISRIVPSYPGIFIYLITSLFKLALFEMVGLWFERFAGYGHCGRLFRNI